MGKNYTDDNQPVKERLAGMTTGQKIDYIWTYFKVQILLGIGLIIAIIWGVHHYMTYVKYEFYGLEINGEALDESREQDIHDYLGMTGHAGVNLEPGLSSEDTTSGGYGSRLSVLLLAGECDFIFTDEDGVKYIEEFFDDYDIDVRDISDSPIHEYFGLEDDVHYMIMAGLSGNEEYMKSFEAMLKDIENGKLK